MPYKIEKDKVIIDKDTFNEENEIHYLNFILGYDLLNDLYKKSICSECDINYDFSDYISREFIKSEEYQNTRYSTYEMLEKWLENNILKIKKEYYEFIGSERNIYKVGNYVCEVDDINYDNKEESIVMIYKSEKDYKNGNYIEQVSLNNKDIKENIANYIKNNYLIKIKER